MNKLSTIAEIEAELEAGTATLADAHAVLAPRALRDSASGKRAARWIAAHPLTAARKTRKSTTKAPVTVVAVPTSALGFAPAAKATQPVAERPAEYLRAETLRKIHAQAEYRRAFEAAPAGQKKYAGSRAYAVAMSAK